MNSPIKEPQEPHQGFEESPSHLPKVKLLSNQHWDVVSVNGKEETVPKGWGADLLGSLAALQKGSNLSRKNAQPGTIPVVAGGKKPSGFHNASNRPGGVITVSASGANAGYVAYYDEPIFATDCTTIMATNLHQGFLFEALRRQQGDITQLQVGGAQPHVYPSDLKLLQVSYPEEKHEQALIAQALATQEAQVADLRKLAALERQRLAWLSDELLSGRLRVEEDPTAESVVVSRNEKGEPVEVLPGVKVVRNRGWKTVETLERKVVLPLDWEFIPLGKIVGISAGQSPAGNLVNPGFPSNECLDFHQGNADFSKKITNNSGKVIHKDSAPRVCTKGSLLLSVRAPVGALNFAGNDLCYGRGLCAIVPTDSATIEYIYWQLKNHKDQLQSKAQGSTFEAVKVSDVRDLEIPSPKVPEQTLISQVLTAQETQASEIERLADLEQKRLEWLSDELLSGRLRIQAQADGQPNLLAAKDSIP